MSKKKACKPRADQKLKAKKNKAKAEAIRKSGYTKRLVSSHDNIDYIDYVTYGTFVDVVPHVRTTTSYNSVTECTGQGATGSPII